MAIRQVIVLVHHSPSLFLFFNFQDFPASVSQGQASSSPPRQKMSEQKEIHRLIACHLSGVTQEHKIIEQFDITLITKIQVAKISKRPA